MATGAITNTGTLTTTFYIPAGEANPCVRFGYGPQTIFNHTRAQVSGSMNSDPINIMHTNQQSTKGGMKKELEVDFISSTLKLQGTTLDE